MNEPLTYPKLPLSLMFKYFHSASASTIILSSWQGVQKHFSDYVLSPAAQLSLITWGLMGFRALLIFNLLDTLADSIKNSWFIYLFFSFYHHFIDKILRFEDINIWTKMWNKIEPWLINFVKYCLYNKQIMPDLLWISIFRIIWNLTLRWLNLRIYDLYHIFIHWFVAINIKIRFY
jgi:hypothetical protein